MSKKTYRVRNWKEYNQALVRRGSLTFWFDEKCLSQWRSEKQKTGRGRPELYSDLAIQTGLTLKALFNLTFRGTEGFIQSLLGMLEVTIEAPDYSLLCKRQKSIKIDLPKKALASGEALHLAFDTTGLKVYGEGEWKVRQHGWVKHRLWRKFHLAMNTQNQQIEAFELTDLGIQIVRGFRHKRSLAETSMFRVKTLLGNRLSTRKLQHQKTEVAVWCQIINKMTMLGMPESVAIN